MRDQRETPFASLTDAELEARWREHLDAADDNDEYGGHVGISRYHRELARAIGDEQRRRRPRPDYDPHIDWPERFKEGPI